MVDWFVGWWFDWLVGWLIGWLIGWWVGGLIGWLISWLVGGWVDWLVDCLVGGWVDRKFGQLIARDIPLNGALLVPSVEHLWNKSHSESPHAATSGGTLRNAGHRNVQRFRGGLVFKAHRLCASLNSRLESNKEKKREEWRTRLPLDGALLVQADCLICDLGCLIYGLDCLICGLDCLTPGRRPPCASRSASRAPKPWRCPGRGPGTPAWSLLPDRAGTARHTDAVGVEV